jgi:hypothetical protein
MNEYIYVYHIYVCIIYISVLYMCLCVCVSVCVQIRWNAFGLRIVSGYHDFLCQVLMCSCVKRVRPVPFGAFVNIDDLQV